MFSYKYQKKNTSYREKAQNNDGHENNNEDLEEQEGHTTIATNNVTNLEVNINQVDSQTNTEDITLKNDSNNNPNNDKNNDNNNDNNNVNVNINVNENNNNIKNEDNEIQELEDCGRPSLLRVCTEHEWSNEMLNNYEAELKNAILNAQNSFKGNDFNISNISNISDVTNPYAVVSTTNDRGEKEHHESENRNVNEDINTDINTNSNQDIDYSIDTEPTRRHSSLFRVGNDEQWNESEINDYENELREQMKYLAYVTASEKQRDDNNNNSTTNNNDNLTYDNERMIAMTTTPSSRSQYERDSDEINKLQPQNIDFQKMKETISMENENEIRKQIEFLRQQLKSHNEGNTPGNDGKRDNYYSQYYYYYYYYHYYYQQQQQQQEQHNQQINPEQESRS